jgi:hypothetical protein
MFLFFWFYAKIFDVRLNVKNSVSVRRFEKVTFVVVANSNISHYLEIKNVCLSGLNSNYEMVVWA